MHDIYFYLLDFSSTVGGKACGEEGLEKWYVAGGECINGVRYSYKRRKRNSQCRARKTFEKT